jgi:gas vesicle protein
MKFATFFLGVVAAGVAAAYLLDEKKGQKRRKVLRKRANQALEDAREAFHGYSKQLEPHIKKYSEQVKERAEEFSDQGRQKVEEIGHNGWSPSARALGATASALAFYGAGRSGPIGSMMRTVALGLFTKALLASR